MKVLSFLCLVLLLPAALFVAACDEADPTREDFLRDAEERVMQLREDAAELREDIATGEAAQEVEAEADRLDERIAEAEAKLDEIRASSDDEWEDLKADCETAVGDAGDLAERIGRDLGLN